MKFFAITCTVIIPVNKATAVYTTLQCEWGGGGGGRGRGGVCIMSLEQDILRLTLSPRELTLHQSAPLYQVLAMGEMMPVIYFCKMKDGIFIMSQAWDKDKSESRQELNP